MSTRKHWVGYLAGNRQPFFDKLLTHNIILGFPSYFSTNLVYQPWRSTLRDVLKVCATVPVLKTHVTVREFRLPKKLRRGKNPITSWRKFA